MLSVLGQACAGVANCFAVSVPTMVSQNWFPEQERLVSCDWSASVNTEL